MLVVLPDPGPSIRAAHLRGCPFCAANMLMYQRADYFCHPGVASDTDCLLSGKCFKLDDSAKWNGRAA